MATVLVVGADASGNGNNWTANNINVTTSGSTYDSMTDVPTLTSATASNFAVLNPLDKGGNITLSAANLNYSTGATNMVRATMQIPSTGKWYWECTQTSSNAEQFGIATASASTGTYLGGDANGWSYGGSGNKFNNNSSSAYGASFTNGDVIGVAFDADAGTLTFYKNNVSQGTAFSSLTGSYFPAVGGNLSSGVINFGQRPFAYTPPTGYVALNTYNLPTPTIGATASSQANKYFDAKLYTGTGSAQSITGLNFQPDFVWIKSRSNAGDHGLVDAVRGRSKVVYSDLTDAEGTSSATEDVTAFNSDGFSLGTSARFTSNNNGWTFASWNWKANGTGVTNTAGSITSTVSANTTSGFSVVTYTGNGVASTVGHGLGVAPKMIIVKNRAGVESWRVGHSGLNGGSSPWNYYVNLNTTSAQGASSSVFNNTAPTSSVFSIANDSAINGSGQSHVAYCFSEVAGFSKFGSYTGNGSSDGTFVYTGFKPKFILVKRTDTTANWVLIDTARDTYNASGLELFPNLSNAENDNRPELDVLSNGFKLRWTYTGTNASGGNYVYACFAEHPFKYSLGK